MKKQNIATPAKQQKKKCVSELKTLYCRKNQSPSLYPNARYLCAKVVPPEIKSPASSYIRCKISRRISLRKKRHPEGCLFASAIF